MPTPLKSAIDALASNFAREIVAVIRRGSLDEIFDVTSAGSRAKRGARAARPTPTTRSTAASPPPSSPTARAPARSRRGKPSASNLAARIAEHVEANPGLTGEVVRAALGVDRPRWSKAVALAVATGKVRREREKRAAKYWPG
jgi:hypothetical protein